MDGRAAGGRRGAQVCEPRRQASWLNLAATPTFAVMALLTGSAGDPIGKLCAPGLPAWMGGMTLMYLLMSVFHAPPWLRLVGLRLRARDDPDIPSGRDALEKRSNP